MRTSSELPFKRGDELIIDMLVTDKNNTNSLMLYEILKKAEKEYAYAVYFSIDTTQQFTDVLNAGIAYRESTLIDITGWSISAQLRWCGRFIDDLDINVVDALNGSFQIKCPVAKTKLWVPRRYQCDIEFITSEPIKVSSDTFTINVMEDITQNG